MIKNQPTSRKNSLRFNTFLKVNIILLTLAIAKLTSKWWWPQIYSMLKDESEANCWVMQVAIIGMWANSWLSTQTLGRNINICIIIFSPCPQAPSPPLRSISPPASPLSPPIITSPQVHIHSLHHNFQRSSHGDASARTEVDSRCWASVLLRPANRSTSRLKCRLVHAWESSLSESFTFVDKKTKKAKRQKHKKTKRQAA